MKSTSSKLQLRAHAAQRLVCRTPAEVALWQRLRAGKLGVYFRREVPLIDRYIADFYAASAKLVLEVDGGYHTLPARQRADARRDRRLERAGFRVLRLPNDLVLTRIDQAIALVRAALVTRTR